MTEKLQNFTKEFAINYFQNNNSKPVLTLEHTFSDTNIKVILKKEFETIKGEQKKIYNFYIFIGEKCVYENRKKKSKGDSFDEVFSFLYKLSEYKLYKRKKNSSEVLEFDTEGFMNDFGYLVEESSSQNIFENKEDLTKKELNNYLMKALEDKKVQEKILELKDINSYILDIESKRNTITEIPEKLFEIALRERGTVSKLEKVLINKAKKVIIKCYLENVSLSNEYIKEFDIRFFDYNIYGEKSPSKYATTPELKIVPKDKNLMRLVELESKNSKNQFANSGHSGKWEYDETLKKYIYVTYQKGRLELDLGWEYLDIINFLSLKMKESIYFFRPNQQEKEVSLDTYLISVIKQALINLRNYISRVDSFGRIRRWKDDLIIRKLKEIKYILDEKKYNSSNDEQSEFDFTVENVVRELKEYNNTIKDPGAKISRKDVEEFINNLSTERISIESFVEDDDGEMENNGILSEIWDSNGVGGSYDTQAVGESKFKQEKLTDIFKKIFPTTEEQIALEFILDNFSNLTPSSSVAVKKVIKVDSVEFNKSLVAMGGKEIIQTQLDLLVQEMITKIMLNRDLFSKILGTGNDSEDKEFLKKNKKETLSDFNSCEFNL